MPRNKDFRCDPFVKKAVKKLHNNCCNNRHSHKVLGKHLNLLLEIKNIFEAKKYCVVCHQLYRNNLLPMIQNEPNNKYASVDQNTDLNETPPNNIPVADPSLQQVNENERNVDQNSGLNEPPPNNVPVAGPPPPQVNENERNMNQAPQDLNEDQNEEDPDQQSTSIPRCGFTTNFPTNTLKACNTDGRRKSYMDIIIVFRVNTKLTLISISKQ